jgi:hypothetical protein
MTTRNGPGLTFQDIFCHLEDEPDFIYRIVTQDETWVNHFDPESKKKTTEDAVETSWLTLSEEIQEGAISSKDDGFIF